MYQVSIRTASLFLLDNVGEASSGQHVLSLLYRHKCTHYQALAIETSLTGQLSTVIDRCQLAIHCQVTSRKIQLDIYLLKTPHFLTYQFFHTIIYILLPVYNLVYFNNIIGLCEQVYSLYIDLSHVDAIYLYTPDNQWSYKK